MLPLLTTVGCCLLAFSIGLIFVQRSGNYFVAMFDDYSATLPLLIVVILENVAVAWVYGTDKYVCAAEPRMTPPFEEPPVTGSAVSGPPS